MNYKKYPKYKPSGIECLPAAQAGIGEIPEHWEVKKMRFVGRFTSSGIDKKIIDNEPLVKIVNYTDIYGNSSLILNSKRNYMVVSCPKEKIIEHSVKKGDLIFTPSSETIIDIGLSALVDEDLENTVYSYHVLRFRFIIDVDHNFKKYICNNYFVLSQFSANAKGTTRQILNRENFNDALVILPPLPEQTAIANFLDDKTAKIDTLIEKKKKLIELYKEERTAVINHYVLGQHLLIDNGQNVIDNGQLTMDNYKLSIMNYKLPPHWEVKKLKYVAKLEYGESLSTDTRLQGEVPVYGSNGITGFHSIAITKAPCIIIGRKGSFGKINWSDIPCFPIDTTYYIDIDRCNENLRFLYFLLTTLNLDSISKDTGVPGLNRDDAYEKDIPIPPIFEQHQIVELIETETKRIDEKIARTEKEIELLQEYRTALISEVVTGKIKVVDD